MGKLDDAKFWAQLAQADQITQGITTHVEVLFTYYRSLINAGFSPALAKPLLLQFQLVLLQAIFLPNGETKP